MSKSLVLVPLEEGCLVLVKLTSYAVDGEASGAGDDGEKKKDRIAPGIPDLLEGGTGTGEPQLNLTSG